MEQDAIVSITQKMLVLVLQISAPLLLSGVVVGLAISVFQTVTQIQESTLTFVPKILIGVITLIVLMPWIVGLMVTTVTEFFDTIPSLIH